MNVLIMCDTQVHLFKQIVLWIVMRFIYKKSFKQTCIWLLKVKNIFQNNVIKPRWTECVHANMYNKCEKRCIT